MISTGLVYALIQYIHIQDFSFAWTLNFMLMACVLTFTETLKSPLISDYFKEKTWESKGKTYESLGINYFRKLLV